MIDKFTRCCNYHYSIDKSNITTWCEYSTVQVQFSPLDGRPGHSPCKRRPLLGSHLQGCPTMWYVPAAGTGGTTSKFKADYLALRQLTVECHNQGISAGRYFVICPAGKGKLTILNMEVGPFLN